MKKNLLSLLAITMMIATTIQAQTITRVAGKSMSQSGCGGEGEPALLAEIPYPGGIAFDTSGNLYYSDSHCDFIRKINHKGVISTVVGNGITGYSGNDSSAVLAHLSTPKDLVFDSQNNMYFSDQNGTCIRKVSAKTGIITTIVGDGIEHKNEQGVKLDNNNDDGVNRQLSDHISIDIQGLSIDNHDNLYITEYSMIRKIDLKKNLIIRFAGNGKTLNGVNVEGDGQIASNVSIGNPKKIGFDKNGNAYFTEVNLGKGFLRKVNNQGIISTIAGCNCDDTAVIISNGLARKSTILFPLKFHVDNLGNKYIVSQSENLSGKDALLLLKIDTNGMIKQLMDFKSYASFKDCQINCLTSDKNGNIYVGFLPYSDTEKGGFIYKISF